jgi:hypothetical protein
VQAGVRATDDEAEVRLHVLCFWCCWHHHARERSALLCSIRAAAAHYARSEAPSANAQS